MLTKEEKLKQIHELFRQHARKGRILLLSDFEVVCKEYRDIVLEEVALACFEEAEKCQKELTNPNLALRDIIQWSSIRDLWDRAKTLIRNFKSK